MIGGRLSISLSFCMGGYIRSIARYLNRIYFINLLSLHNLKSQLDVLI
jgi:hypothetical protein